MNGPEELVSGLTQESDLRGPEHQAELDDFTTEDQLVKQIATLTSENQHLQKYVTDAEVEVLLDDSLPPWVGSSRYAAPLLVAYEARMKELEQANQAFKDDLEALRKEARQLASENDELHKQVQSNVNNILGKLNDGARLGVLGSEEQRELEQRQEWLMEENEILRTQEAASKKALDELKAHVQKRDSVCAKLEADLHQSEQARVSVERRVSDMASERQALQVELCRAREELGLSEKEKGSLSEDLRMGALECKAHTAALQQLQQRFDEATNKLQLDLSTSRHEHQEQVRRCQKLQSRADELERLLEQSEEKERATSRELSSCRHDLEAVTKALATLEKSLEACKQREIEVVKKVTEATDSYEELKLQRDQAVAREEQAKREAARLSDKLSAELAEARRQADQRVSGIVEKCKEKEDRLMLELRSVELACAEQEDKRARAAREKQAAESALSKLSAAIQAEQDELRNKLTATQSMVRQAEADKLLAEEAASRARAELQQMKEHNQAESDVRAQQVTDLRRVLDTKEAALASARAECSELANEVSGLRDECARLSRAKQAAEESATREVTRVTEKCGEQVQEIQARLDEAYTLHEQAERRAAELLQQQTELSSKWREETRSSVLHFRRVVSDLKKENGRLAGRNAELENKVTSLVREYQESAGQQTQNEKVQAALQTRCEAAERRVAELSSQLAGASARETQLLEQVKSAQRDLDRSLAEQRRLQRYADAGLKGGRVGVGSAPTVSLLSASRARPAGLRATDFSTSSAATTAPTPIVSGNS